VRTQETTVTATELLNICHGAATQLVDVRSPSEFATGHVPGAVNIPMEQIEARLGDLKDGCVVVLICQAGARARTVAEWLKSIRQDVLVLEGGTAAWCKAGYPVVSCASTRWSLERQVRLGAGLLILIGVGLTLGVSRDWLGLPAFVGLGLTFSGLTGFCPMGVLLSKLPWNQGRSSASGSAPGARCASGQ
jgi:rhodanese-related sulfurtransferase